MMGVVFPPFASQEAIAETSASTMHRSIEETLIPSVLSG
jgi:hypothetical protein